MDLSVLACHFTVPSGNRPGDCSNGHGEFVDLPIQNCDFPILMLVYQTHAIHVWYIYVYVYIYICIYIYANIWGILMVNVPIYGHESYGRG